ncbi:hypothetical protein CFP56_028229, partial [Quercus suber]
ADRRGVSESHVKKVNRRLCCRAKDYENIFLSTQMILLVDIVTHEASSDYDPSRVRGPELEST